MDLERLRVLAGMTQVTESAPPGMEDTVKQLKQQYPGEPEKAFATAWSIYNKQQGTDTSEVSESDDADADDMLDESDDEEARRWAEDMFRSAGVALPHQTRVKPEFKRVTGGKRRPEPDPIAGDDERHSVLKARAEAMDILIPLVKERDRLVYRAERWGPLPPAVKLDIDDAHYPTRDIEGKIEKARQSIETLKNYIATKKNLYKKRVMEDGYSGDESVDAEINAMLQNASDSFVDKGDALVKVAYYLLDLGIDSTRVEEIMSAIEQDLTAEEPVAEAAGSMLNADDINAVAVMPLPDAKDRARELIAKTYTRDDKKNYLLRQLDNARSAMAVTKLLYDMLLAGEGNRVVGSKYSDKFRESSIAENGVQTMSYSDASKLAHNIENEKWRRLQRDSNLEPHEDSKRVSATTWRDLLRNLDKQVGGTNKPSITSEDLDNGYGDERSVDGEDYFPDGATTSVVDDVGPRGAAQGDNPMQKSIKVDETYQRLYKAYQKHLNT